MRLGGVTLTQDVLILLGVAAAAAYIAVRALWRAYVIARMRRVAAAAAPAVENLDRAINRFFERFPPPQTDRLPLAAADYPPARRRKPSPPRTKRTRRRQRRRW